MVGHRDLLSAHDLWGSAIDEHHLDLVGPQLHAAEHVEHLLSLVTVVQGQHHRITDEVVEDRQRVALEVGRLEVAERLADVEQGPQGEAFVEDHRIGTRLDEVVADEDRSCTTFNEALEGEDDEVLLAVIAFEVVRHANPAPAPTDEGLELAAADEGQRGRAVEHVASGLRNRKAGRDVADRLVEPHRNAVEFVDDLHEAGEVDHHEVVDRHVEVAAHRLDECRCTPADSADDQRRRQLLLPNGHTVPVDGEIEVSGNRQDRRPPESRIDADEHDHVGEGDAAGGVALRRRVVRIHADRTVRANE